jgi:chromosome segregation ATPase
MKRFLSIILIFAIVLSVGAFAQDSEATLQKLIDEGYLPARADGTLAAEEPVDRLTFAMAISKLLSEIEASSPKAQEEILRKLTVQLQAELARMMSQTKEFEESLARLQAASDLAQDDLVQVTAQSQKLAQEMAATSSKLEALEQNIGNMELSYQTLEQSLQNIEAGSQSLSEEIDAARDDFQRELLENKSQLALIQGQIAQTKEISEATFQRQGELLSELEERALTLRQRTQELVSLTAALEQRSTQLDGKLESTNLALHESVNKLELDLNTTIAQLRYTERKLELEKAENAARVDKLDEALSALTENFDAQQRELDRYQAQNKRWGKLGVAFGAVAIPFFLLLIY